jgi:hypothetical protein
MELNLGTSQALLWAGCYHLPCRQVVECVVGRSPIGWGDGLCRALGGDCGSGDGVDGP